MVGPMGPRIVPIRACCSLRLSACSCLWPRCPCFASWRT